MKIFSAKQLYEADEFTIREQQISSTDLMERAGKAVFEWLQERLQNTEVTIAVFCGIGNNGGDGLVIARHLLQHQYNVKVYVVNFSDKRSKDFLINLDRLKNEGCWPVFLSEQTEPPELVQQSIIIDAIFGIGLSRPPVLWVQKLIEHINGSKGFTLSIDIPSGLFMNSVPEDAKAVVRASHVLSFQTPKLVFFLPETGVFLNNWELIDIGLSQEYLQQTQPEAEVITKYQVLSFYQPREKFSHKGTYGHALLIGGSYGKIGAVSLAAKACLYSGAGKVSVYTPKCGYVPLQASLPEVMVETAIEEAIITSIDPSFTPEAVGLGVGLGTHEKTVEALRSFLETSNGPIVIDADALNIIAMHPELLKRIPKGSVLTPHPGELKRLLGVWLHDFDKIEKAQRFSEKFGIVLVLKGAHTLIFSKGKLYINSTGNPGMATAGSGDVLTGMITSFMAQGYNSTQAALFAVYLHGRSADLAVPKTGYQALTAGVIVDHIGAAFIDLFESDEPKDLTES
ncbi:NAD(P)H-hydrate dehydratase [Flavobacteriaceae bacterium M23B6Z8]